jgi:hypothetical protein
VTASRSSSILGGVLVAVHRAVRTDTCQPSSDMVGRQDVRPAPARHSTGLPVTRSLIRAS